MPNGAGAGPLRRLCLKPKTDRIRRVKLATNSFGAPTATPPLLIVHGLFGSGRNWAGMARRLSDQRHVITVDLRNHGDSPWADANSYADLAADLAEVIAPFGEMDVLGHSMGGKAAMLLALGQPAIVNRLIVADIAPTRYTHSHASYIRAMMALPLDTLASRAAADSALAATVHDAGTRAFLMHSLDLRADPPQWRLNLPALLAAMDQIIGWPDSTGVFSGPALFLTGARSPYVTAQHHDKIRTLFPAAQIDALADAGHWLHVEQPAAFETAVRAFLV